ncbi:hypothetical protein ClosIBUN13A_CONTIG231g03672 [Clostridium sp. IBUN13A]|nr:hypothetical protein CBDKU1_15850 [Clostridium butyricum DKU-01]KJZ89233.1 hypothetical protein ClosIBUN125C_CONTIG14g00887 [Clostridium sp. IBUN125C]KJZ91692.1 hypothetical protein ClosIBUN13A_CONTIG231g03672 [Clostridium sp. IBUN13A]KJZ92347.1 hypothetical protein ClosIBUN22A_CONTIG172g03564 [Clostridium sp. IBUN22A]KJZ93732.1 hypothetical protein ClosIBUN62F_CONTIG35g01349 [Clostridium sp. IBUN62F]
MKKKINMLFVVEKIKCLYFPKFAVKYNISNTKDHVFN